MKVKGSTTTSTCGYALPGLSKQEVKHFRTQGYAGPFRALDSDQMPSIRRKLESIIRTPSRLSVYPHRLRHLDSKTVYDLCVNPEILGRMASLFGPDLVLWLATVFDKAPWCEGSSDEIPWHADSHHWGHEPLIMGTAWLAITEATVDNGCVKFIPGSHRRNVPSAHTRDRRFTYSFAGIAAEQSMVDESASVPVPLRPGEFVIFHQDLLHGSGPNLTGDRRIGLSIRITLPSVRIRNEDLPSILVTGEDQYGVNRLTSPPASDPDIDELRRTLPDANRFTFDREVTGFGWHMPVREGELAYRWTGPETESWLEFRIASTGEHLLRCEILHGIEADTVGGLVILANDHRLELDFTATPHGVRVGARVPAEAIAKSPGFVRITFRVPRTLRPCDLDPESQDVRPLGIAVSSLSLTAANA